MQAMTEQLAEAHARELRRRRHGQRSRAAPPSTWKHCAASWRRRGRLRVYACCDALQLVCGVDPGVVVYRRGGTREAFIRWYLKPYVQRVEANNSVRADRVACVALLLEHGASPNPGGVHSPPLILTCSGYDPRNEKQECRECSCSLPIVNMLLAAGGDADARHRDGNYTFSPLLRCVIRTGWDNNGRRCRRILKAGKCNSPEFGGKH